MKVQAGSSKSKNTEMGYSRQIMTIIKLRQKLISRNKKIHDENGIDKGDNKYVNMNIYPNLHNSFITKAGCVDHMEVLVDD
jgi:hypothetical protein